MPQEIERKFLVTGDSWKQQSNGVLLRQGYLNSAKERTVRVRVAGDAAFLTIKGPSRGAVRAEFEYAIPLEEAVLLLDTLAEKPLIEKERYTVSHAGFVWEIDVFLGDNAGLVVAEIELPHEETVFPLPEWVGKEVTQDARYFNSNLGAHPFCRW